MTTPTTTPRRPAARRPDPRRRAARGRRALLGGAVLGPAVLAGSLLAAPQAAAHGAPVMPGSRTYLCWKDGLTSSGQIVPNNPACAAAVAQSGTGSLYNWFAVLRSDGAGRTAGFIPDGRLCSGDAVVYDFSGYDLAPGRLARHPPDVRGDRSSSGTTSGPRIRARSAPTSPRTPGARRGRSAGTTWRRSRSTAPPTRRASARPATRTPTTTGTHAPVRQERPPHHLHRVAALGQPRDVLQLLRRRLRRRQRRGHRHRPRERHPHRPAHRPADGPARDAGHGLHRRLPLRRRLERRLPGRDHGHQHRHAPHQRLDRPFHLRQRRDDREPLERLLHASPARTSPSPTRAGTARWTSARPPRSGSR